MAEHENITFIKMQGTGNDFVVLDNRERIFTLAELIKLTPKMCNRKLGVGADGLLALQQPAEPGTDFTMIYRNADGSDAGMCGNGSRCLARYASRLGLGEELTFRVHEHIYHASVGDHGLVSVSFPVSTRVSPIAINGDSLWQVFPGTEHVAKEVPEQILSQEEQLVSEGRKLRHHSRFQPKGTNVNFFYGITNRHLELQTYERGVEDLTLACGTGAIASALCWHHVRGSDNTQNIFEVDTKGGTLNVEFSYDPATKSYNDIKLMGPAEFVFEGKYYV